MYYIYITKIYIMYELDYPDYISSLDEGVEHSQTISIGDSLSYKTFTNEYLKTLKKDFKKYILKEIPIV